MNKKAIVGVLNNPAVSLNSHSAGMVNIVASLFEASILTEYDNWNEFDELIIYHGTNFKPGTFNVIGGINDDVIIRAYKLEKFTGKIYSLDGFQLNEFSRKRKLQTWDNYKDIELIELPKKENIVIGDSHSISVWEDNSYTISRNDGKTLFGFLKENLDLSSYKKVTLYFGNIDIRFHLARQADPIKATEELFTKYVEYAKKYNATITELLPLETEDRKLPKSGQYKGKNFYGSLELRKELRAVANNIIYNSGLEINTWPSNFVDENGNLKFEIMEPKQSVHIRPKYYRKEFIKQLKLF